MRIGVIVNKGFEKIAVMQIRELLEIKSVEVFETIVIFETTEWDDVAKFVYMNQIANRIIYFIDKIDLKIVDVDNNIVDDEDLLKSISHIVNKNDSVLNGLISKNIDFRSSVKSGNEMEVIYLESEIGGILVEHAKKNGFELKVNLRNPILNFYTYINNSEAFVGIDLSDDLSKRDYKLFNNAVSLKGPTAFGLLMTAGFAPKDRYLNPCCYSGTLEIEAALYATRTSHRFYSKNFPFMKICTVLLDLDDSYWDKFYKSVDSKISNSKNFYITGSDKLLSSITAASKNAKIAGIMDAINFRRVDLDWMDIKYDENSLDKIITFIPGSSKHLDLSKEYKEIFYQAEYLLKKDGVLAIMCLAKNLLIESSKEYFDVDKTFKVNSGKQEMDILIFKKK